MTIDYSLMDESVDKICHSLRTEPNDWKLGLYCITAPDHLGSIQIEIGLQDTFMSVRTYKHSITSEKVFSYDQGKKICKAYYEAKSLIGSQVQQDILRKTCSTTLEKPAKTSKPEIAPRDPKDDSGCNCYVAYILVMGLLIYIFTS